ncbi:hypothetical protein [Enteractinococcus coprophilus]|uniref:Peptidase C39-like domain-containing protein n=1 Tax=Enteractinococcus coprophilus TaxID=1027633 RepID=A0A543AMF9_9MICC|nr:hypothetical protein [Enteractinococcus coprophilus]TQL73761.1 hypothetical protein FB556_0207 [Enteractinococcus coprophilus]
MPKSNTSADQQSGNHAVMTDYSPELYAFRFPNAFVNHLWRGRVPPLIGRKVELTSAGRCGGMAFASLDFYHLGTPVPSFSTQDFAPSCVPADGYPLADYIYCRQLHSMLTTVRGIRDGIRYLRWSGYSATTIAATTKIEEQKVIESLDRGQPVVLGLIKATSRRLKAQGVNHQVVCYGYRLDSSGRPEFRVYDPNDPFRESSNDYRPGVLRRVDDDGEQSGFVYQERLSHRTDRWRGFFVVDYRPQQPDAALISVAKGSVAR